MTDQPINLSKSPRWTPAWQRLWNRHRAEIEKAFDEPGVRAAWQLFVAAIEEGEAREYPESAPAAERSLASLEKLWPLLKRHAPGFTRACGEHLPDWLLAFALAGIGADPGRVPLRLADTLRGELLHMKPAERRTALQEFGRIIDAYQPAGKPGRPPGTPKPEKSGKARVSPDLARAVYQAQQLDGIKDWKQIARAVLKVSLPSDPRARERLRGRIRHLAYVGRLLYRLKN